LGAFLATALRRIYARYRVRVFEGSDRATAALQTLKM
jgi:hypothetical protein